MSEGPRERGQTTSPIHYSTSNFLVYYLIAPPHVLTHALQSYSAERLIFSFSLIHFNHPLAHGYSASRAETWSDAVSPLSPSLGTSSYDARHHHPQQVRDLLPDLSATAHETRPDPRFPTPTAYLSTQLNLSRGSLGFTPFNRCRVCGPSLNFLHPLLSSVSRLFPRSRPERSNPSNLHTV